MKIIEKEIGELTAYENNSRTHSDEQINQIIASINEFGFTNPLLINPDNGVIAGHGRLTAAIELDMDKVPCIVLEGLTEAQERAYVIADNQLATNAHWDYELLAFEMDKLSEFQFDISLLGFSNDELDLIKNGWDAEFELPEKESDDLFKISLSGSPVDRDTVIDEIKTIAERFNMDIKIA